MTEKELKEFRINQLVKALDHHKNHPPKLVTREYCKLLGVKFGLNWKTIEAAFNIGSQKGLL